MTSERRVCADCFNDEPIKRFVRSRGALGTCDFCGAMEAAAAPWNETLQFILEGFDTLRSKQPDQSIDWDWESGFLPTSYSTEELLQETGSPVKNESVLADLVGALGSQSWYNRYVNGSGLYGQLDNWGMFCHRIIYRNRFFFHLPMAGDPGEFEPEQFPSIEVLDELANLIRSEGLVKLVGEGERFFRARQHHPAERILTASELGPPRAEQTRSSRMSPAGIAMFYGANDLETAREEVVDAQSAARGQTAVTVAAFLMTKAFKVIDLTQANIPPVPSIFDAERRPVAPAIQFLHRFAEELARPISKDGAEHIEYVPTEVVTEYLKYVFKDQDDEPVRGVLYSSSNGGTCCAVFMESDECGGRAADRFSPRTQWLRLEEGTVRRFNVEFHTAPRFFPVNT